MRRSALLLALGIAATAACGGGESSGPSSRNIDGTWSGSNAGVTLTVTINEGGGSMTGTGAIGSINGSIGLTVDGTFTDPNVTMTMSAQGFQDLIFTGSMLDNDSMEGALNGSGFSGFAMTLNKN